MSTTLHIAVAQPLVVPGDVAHNLEQMQPLVEAAARDQAHLVIFSECSITGYDLGGRALEAAMSLSDPRLDAVAEMARRCGVAIVAGLYERQGQERYNTAVAFMPDGKRVVQRKHHIVGHEAKIGDVCSGPRQRVMFDVNGMTIGILICADSGTPGIRDEMAQQGCQVVLGITAGLGSSKNGYSQHDLTDAAKREAYLKAAESVCFPKGMIADALRFDMAVASTNQAGYVPEMGYFHPGHSAVVDHTGRVAALIPGCFVFEHLRPRVAVGTVHASTRPR